jgi:CheY-like chemotaxis protein
MSRFLVVDDDSSSVSALTKLLTGDGHEVAPYENGGDAVEALSRQPFDAVLTDLEMPVADGSAVVQAARDRSPTACRIVMTAAPEAGEKLVEQGACFVVNKPIDYDRVHDTVSTCRSRGGRVAPGECAMRETLVQLGLRRP